MRPRHSSSQALQQVSLVQAWQDGELKLKLGGQASQTYSASRCPADPVARGRQQRAEGRLCWLQVLLKPSLEDLQQRVAARAAKGGHFMPASLLQSQLDALEPDASALEFGGPIFAPSC